MTTVRKILALGGACLMLVGGGCSTSNDDPADAAPTTVTPSSPDGCELVDDLGLDGLAGVTPAQASELRQAFESDEEALATMLAARIHSAAQADIAPSSDETALLLRMCEEGYRPVLADEYTPALGNSCAELMRAAGGQDPATAVIDPLTQVVDQAGPMSGSLAASVLAGRASATFLSGPDWEALAAACDELPGVEPVPATTTVAPPPETTTTTTTAAPPPAAPPTTECHGASGCAFDNGIDLDALRAELAADLSGFGSPTSPGDIDCEQGVAAPQRVAIGARFACVVPFELHNSLTVFDVTVTGIGTYSWEYADV